MKKYVPQMALGTGLLLFSFVLTERQAFIKEIEERSGGTPPTCYDCEETGAQCYLGAPNHLAGDARCLPPRNIPSSIPIIAQTGTSQSGNRISRKGKDCPDIVITGPNYTTTIECGTIWICHIRRSDRDCDGTTSME